MQKNKTTVQSTTHTTPAVSLKLHGPSPQLTVTIKHIHRENLKYDYINLLMQYLNIKPNTVAQAHFNNTYCFITFTNLFTTNHLTRLRLHNTNYNSLLIHNLLTIEQSRIKSIYYHAIKSNKITGYKCVLNLRNNTYERRCRLNQNKTDWDLPPLKPNDIQTTEWTDSLNQFRKSLKDQTHQPTYNIKA